MRNSLRGAIAALSLVIVVFGSVAMAAAAPVQWQTVDVTLHDEQPAPVLLVSGTLPETAKLPAEVELAVPKGAQFQWAGEILGGPASQDPSVKYTVSEKNGMDVYSFTLAKAKIGQIEVLLPGSVNIAETGYSAALDYTATAEMPQVNVSVRLPQGTQITTPADGASTIPGPTGFSYYQKTFKGVAAGDALNLSFGYQPPAAGATGGPATAGATGSGNTVALVLIVAVFGAAFVVAGRAIGGKMKRAAAVDSEAGDDDPAGSEAVEYFDDTEEVESGNTPPATASATARAATARSAAPSTSSASSADTPPSRGNTRWVIAGVVVAGLALAAFLAGQNSTSAQLVNGTYQRNFGATSICSSADIALAIPAEANKSTAAEKIFKSLEGQAGIGNVTVFVDQPRALVEFCSTTTSEQAIRTALAPTGYVDPNAVSAPAPGTSGGAPVAPGASPGGVTPSAPATGTPGQG